jgi:hypothetical protein
MKRMKSILSALLLIVGLTVSLVPYAHGCDHDYDDDIETEA